MIISASYKTDIPTFYGKWFMNRLKSGYCKMINPYSQQVYRVDLTPQSVDGFVFWTKNIGPFFKYLPEVQERGYAFIVQHTINGYPRELESRVTNYSQTIEHMKKLSGEYGPQVVVWRYDPIIISSLTPLGWHRRNFEELALALEGTTDEVVVSFAQIYKKTKRNMDLAAKELHFNWDSHEAMSDEEIRQLITELAEIAQTHRIRLKICSQQRFLVPGIVEEARCVDADRLERVAHKSIQGITRQKGNRKECGCYSSKDIGEYDTCPHGCVYCYAVQNRALAVQRFKTHDTESEFLFPPKDYVPSENEGVELPRIISLPKVNKKNTGSSAIQEQLF